MGEVLESKIDVVQEMDMKNKKLDKNIIIYYE